MPSDRNTPPLRYRLDRQVALVTGASSGIGHAVAGALAGAGAAVAIHYNSQPGPAEALAREINEAGGSALAIGADVSDEAAVIRLFDETAAASTSWSPTPACRRTRRVRR